MRHLRSLAIATALLLSPPLITASLAQSSGASGSNIPPATAQAASPGAVTNGTTATTTGDSLSPTNGTGGGGMTTTSGVKEGGMDKNPLAHHKKHVLIPSP